MKLRSLGLIGLLGALAGALISWSQFLLLRLVPWWRTIVVYACHGALLAVTTVGLALLLWKRKSLAQWLAWPAVGWLAGYLSWFPVFFVESHEPTLVENIIGTFSWPGRVSLQYDYHEAVRHFTGEPIFVLLAPYAFFGSLSVAYYFFLLLCKQLRARKFVTHALIGSVSGMLGCFIWWSLWRVWPWYFSLLHGTIWGSLVGFGVWKSQQSLQRS